MARPNPDGIPLRPRTLPTSRLPRQAPPGTAEGVVTCTLLIALIQPPRQLVPEALRALQTSQVQVFRPEREPRQTLLCLLAGLQLGGRGATWLKDDMASLGQLTSERDDRRRESFDLPHPEPLVGLSTVCRGADFEIDFPF
ncbi:hypothetical protein T484DRAFT_1751695 [Baffinella frigidus]|nr:hypothetical protein T484DRAFT_1751695 [Cryptophyta sp. CCMP2293]